ncbi:MAG TPA: class I SAM-dependent methyltransferase [Terriglobia bacterium]|jgi:SAM-dependent methyltransferase|nr:class I SAM-dependent methyltransferase [Terriglobia bacterium]
MNWYEELFNEDYDRVYGPAFTPERNTAEAEFIESLLLLPKESQVLDVACGHGRHAIELAKRGHHVMGIDLSERFIERARQASQLNELTNAEFLVGDMRESYFVNRFDGAYSYFTSFGYFDDSDNKKILESVTKALVKGGMFLLETVNRDWTIHKVENQPRRWDEIEPDFFLLEDISFNAHTSRIHTKRIIFDKGQRRTVEYDIKLYTHAELEDMLEEAGLQVVSTFGSKERIPYSVSSPRMIIVSKKQ